MMDVRSFRRGVARVSAIALMSVSMLSWLAAAEEGAAKSPSGKRLYGQFCSACHGVDGRGHTGVSELIRVETPDLTRIALRRNGWFPDVLVQEIIDGRFLIHGEGRMPIWGEVLTRQQIIAITDHLHGLQSRLP